MVFNSFEFLAFFASIATLYWLLPHAAQRLLLLAASYGFYMAWRPGYALLLAGCTLVAYAAGRYLGDPVRSPLRRDLVLAASLAASFGCLFTFKYWRFFGETVAGLSSWLGQPVHWPALDLLLPVGISFYTFQTAGYTIDVYRRQRQPERDLSRFALFASFFPLLVAGPIERASHLIPQFVSRRRFVGDEVLLGTKLVLIGLFKKMVVADNLAPIVGGVYARGSGAEPIEYLLATYAFAFQIYADFSGYSDIAVGTARIMGFDLTANFNAPYLAASPTEFWKRWHISLSTWMRDYVFLKLSFVFSRRLEGVRWLGLREDVWNYAAAVLITMSLIGLWHGANSTFVAWGAMNGLYLALDRALGARLKRLARALRLPRALVPAVGTLLTFHLVCISWIYFRASDLAQANAIVASLASALWSGELFDRGSRAALAEAWGNQHIVWLLTAASVALDVWLGSGKDAARYRILPAPLRAIAYATLLMGILAYGVYGANAFIYFQF